MKISCAIIHYIRYNKKVDVFNIKFKRNQICFRLYIYIYKTVKPFKIYPCQI